jgi:hypothetical protein
MAAAVHCQVATRAFVPRDCQKRAYKLMVHCPGLHAKACVTSTLDCGICVFVEFVCWFAMVGLLLHSLQTLGLQGKEQGPGVGEGSIMALLSADRPALALSGLSLTYFPTEVFWHSACLTFLDLQNNDLHDLPVSLSIFSRLQHLTLDSNKFVAIPEAVFSLKSLRILQVLSLPGSMLFTSACDHDVFSTCSCDYIDKEAGSEQMHAQAKQLTRAK